MTQHGGQPRITCEAIKLAFGGAIRASVLQQGNALGGPVGGASLWHQYQPLADTAIRVWRTGVALDEVSEAPVEIYRDAALALAGDLVMATPGREAEQFEDVIADGISQQALAVATNDAVLVYSLDNRKRTTEFVVPYREILSAEPVVVAVGPTRPGVQLVYQDADGDDQVIVLGIAFLGLAVGRVHQQIRDAFLAHVAVQARRHGAALDDDSDAANDDDAGVHRTEDRNDSGGVPLRPTAGSAGGWTPPGPGPLVGQPVPPWRQGAAGGRRNKSLIVGLAVAAGFAIAVAIVLAVVLLNRDSGLEQGQCLGFGAGQGQDEAIACDSPAAFYEVLLVLPDQPAVAVGQLTQCPPATTAVSWWADEESGELFTVDNPPFNSLARGTLVCAGLVG